jgi:glucoamylase
VLHYLRAIQEADGSWPQNSWLDGIPYWRGIQLDECAFPILLVDLARRNGLLGSATLAGFLPMVRRAAGFVLRNGPVTGQDRWEEDPGFSPFTLGVAIAALLVAAELLDGEAAGLLRDTADAWYEALDGWLYAAGTPLADRVGARGYYVRIAPPTGVHDTIIIKNRPPGQGEFPASEIVSPDALALVRFGLRAADDPRILDTIRAIDASLRVELPAGPCWYRYTADGYGEHADGGPFDGTGIGRLWPLLSGERAHYALAAGRAEEARALLATMEALTSRGGLMPEQVWDTDDIPARELFRGHPSGSAMPLVWAHAEHVKLLRSLADGRVFDLPPQTVQRYLRERAAARVAIWRPDQPIAAIAQGRAMRIDLPAPARIRWTDDGWAHAAETATAATGFGLHVAELPAARLAPGGRLTFTWQWRESGDWAGQDFSVKVTAGEAAGLEQAAAGE